MLDPRRLAVLREFAAQGTIARAAEALSFTPSAVSQQLSQLQRESGVALFRRTGRRLELTDAGRTLAARAEELLARLEEIEAELAQAAGDVRGTVRVAAFQTASRALVLPAFDRLAATHPGLRMELVELEAEDSLPLAARGGVELAIAGEYEHAPRPHVAGLERVYLDPDEMVLALPAAHPAAAGDPVPLAAVRDLAWATGHAGTAYSDMVTRICRAVGGFEPDVRHRVSDMDLLLGLVANERTAALAPMLGRPEREPGVAVRRIAEGSFRRALFVAMRASDRARPATAAAAAAIEDAARTLTDGRRASSPPSR
jgi:DNA-binding transcriptional LysR family regulator